MYLSASDPLPQNSLQGMPVEQQVRMRNCIDAWSRAVSQARQNAYIYPSPNTAYPPERGADISPNLQKDMMLGQRDAKLAAMSILTGQQQGGVPSVTDIPAPEVIPINAAANAELGCAWQQSMAPRLAAPAQRVFLQPAPGAPQRLTPAVVQAIASPVSTPPVVQESTRTIQQQQPAWSPCPPGVPFQGRYVMGAPVCGAIGPGNLVSGGPSLPMAYASIVQRGVGDNPNWSDAFASYQNQAIGGSVMDSLTAHPWIGLLILAGVGLGIAAMGKTR